MHFKIIFLVLILTFKSVLAIDTNANQAIVYDYNTSEVIFEKNADKKIAPASMTKILTTYIAFDIIKNTTLSFNDKCTVSKSINSKKSF